MMRGRGTRARGGLGRGETLSEQLRILGAIERQGVRRRPVVGGQFLCIGEGGER